MRGGPTLKSRMSRRRADVDMVGVLHSDRMPSRNVWLGSGLGIDLRFCSL